MHIHILEKEGIKDFNFTIYREGWGGWVLDQKCEISQDLKKNEFHFEWIDI